MPGLAAQPKQVQLFAKKELLNPHFNGYKFASFNDRDNLITQELELPPYRPTLPVGARVPYSEVRVRTQWEFLTPGWEKGSAWYVAAEGEVVRVAWNSDNRKTSSSVVARIPLPNPGSLKSLDKTDLYPYYPTVNAVRQDLLLVSDGAGLFYCLRLSEENARAEIFAQLPYSNEKEPVLLLDAFMAQDDSIQILVCRPSGEEVIGENKQGSVQRCYRVEHARLATSGFKIDVLSTLEGREIPVYAAFDRDSPNVFVVSGSERYGVVEASEEVALEQDQHQEKPRPKYTWTQTGTDLTISIPVPEKTSKTAIKVHYSAKTLQVTIADIFKPFNSDQELNLWGPIDVEDSTWTLSSYSDKSSNIKILDIYFEKKDANTRWPHMFMEDDGAEEYVDPSERAAMLEKLEKYTQTLTEDNPGVGLPEARMREERDDSVDVNNYTYLQLVQDGRIAIEVAGVELVGSQFANPKQRAHFVAKRDVDALVYKIIAEGMSHEASYSALAFVAASKRSRKYVKVEPTGRWAVVLESGAAGGKNAYVYWGSKRGDENGKQSVVRLGMEPLGAVIVGEGSVLILGTSEDGRVLATVLTDL
ncbi:CS-domain-containing protein [Saitoella complicata NRRL Y-17804]|uniref:NudC domain-containing protein 1 n=1 Tax=Saitoella complicata (strain BCRC 22490 / CBS 7301 / JCM 7358 / NBRC 10748 / NRRL Y-17804) TaxID=698492 RepID=A0A0E9NQQ7_SAICN|nr:CS-domain-containing protein [Saitoella complicata NRRL Y-17804]ODQ50771.1 CS-domain-containing protein [Saitoella complicata NRRL Y-17804]GAO52001.1 hypothetical protein G7K_6089-t1 [Saitoella complicata NRRL Y-17804]